MLNADLLTAAFAGDWKAPTFNFPFPFPDTTTIPFFATTKAE